jgi:hypothetical protein
VTAGPAVTPAERDQERLAAAREQLKDLSTTLSERARVLAYGIIALIWSQAAEGKYLPKGGALGLVVTASLGLAIVAVILDLAQYWVGYRYVRAKMRERERAVAAGTSPGGPLYDERDVLHGMRQGLFTLKLLAAAAATGLLAVSLLGFLLGYLLTPDG